MAEWVVKEVAVDERGRTNLARVRKHDYDRYIVEEFPDGTLVLTPAVTISALELAALRDPVVHEAVAAVRSGRSKPHRRPGYSREELAAKLWAKDRHSR